MIQQTTFHGKTYCGRGIYDKDSKPVSMKNVSISSSCMFHQTKCGDLCIPKLSNGAPGSEGNKCPINKMSLLWNTQSLGIPGEFSVPFGTKYKIAMSRDGLSTKDKTSLAPVTQARFELDKPCMLSQFASGPNKTENYIYQVYENGFFVNKINYWYDIFAGKAKFMDKKQKQEYL